ncbi:uncharacterized protein si:ch211-67e16.3 [Hoplias malabaricus]|uniref:uncharacterized protein si:ch211-67e16.3 n=1 Tax=Hoplias malabaricus TaxID=27720 RepID=UPI00346296EB
MSVRSFFLLLSFSLTYQEETKLNLTTFLQYESLKKGSVSIICHHNGMSNWTMGAKLLNGMDAYCETGSESKRTGCKWSVEGNHIKFTLENVTSEQNHRYKCEVYRRNPLPVLVEQGEIITLFPDLGGCSCPTSPTSSDKPNNECPSALNLSGILTWALIGLLLLLCLYSLSVTAAYIRLRVTRSEEIFDTLTYVPMQVKPKKKVKRHDGDKNAEYMDMRKVPPQTRPIRDMNHNSHQIPSGFTM